MSENNEAANNAMLLIMESMMIRTNRACAKARDLLNVIRSELTAKQLLEAELLMMELHVVMTRWCLRHDDGDKIAILHLHNLAEQRAEAVRAGLSQL